MELIPISNLVIPDNRQRNEFSLAEIEELALSISERGLMHPPVVRNDGVTLVAGERRTRAIQSLYTLGATFQCHGAPVPLGMLPITRLAELSPLALREAELEENTIRVDLSWQERCAAIAELHEIRTLQAAQFGNPHTVTQTAKEIHGANAQGSAVQSTHEAILLREHLANPLVASAKSQKEAVKVVRKLKDAEHRERLAAQFDLTKTEHTLIQGSMVVELPKLPSATFDCILTDPPYGVNADKFGDMADCGHNYEDSWENAFALYQVLAREGLRVCKPEAHLYAFCDITHFQEIAHIFNAEGWEVWSKPLIWAKGNGMLPRPEHGPRYSYEAILFASKGSRRTLKVDNDVIQVSGDAKLLHGAQKPVDLYSNLLARSCLPGNSVLDPFGGSGPILPAASAARCRATYIELLPENYATAVSRLDTPTISGDFTV